MLPEEAQSKLVDEIKLFIQYGVQDAERAEALALVEKYSKNPEVLTVLLEFYKVLPDAREEAVLKVSSLDSVQGVSLLLLVTANYTYNAVVSEGIAHILGELGRDKLPKEILNYFGFAKDEEFIKSLGEVEKLEELAASNEQATCPACQVGIGELHLLGCPVEVCPWCDGQLSKCDCRFEKLDVEEIETEEQVEEFQELLDAQGRIPYEPEQKPAYPGTSEGLDTVE